MLNSVNVLVLGAIFSLGAAPRPNSLGIQVCTHTHRGHAVDRRLADVDRRFLYITIAHSGTIAYTYEDGVSATSRVGGR